MVSGLFFSYSKYMMSPSFVFQCNVELCRVVLTGILALHFVRPAGVGLGMMELVTQIDGKEEQEP